MAALLASLSSLTWGVSDFVGGMTTRRARVLVVVLWSQLVGLCVAFVGAPLFEGSLTPDAMRWGAPAGIAGGVGLLALYQGLASGRAAIVAPVAAVVGAGLPVVFGIGSGERPGTTAALGIAVALPALWLVSRTRSGESTEGFAAGVLAGAGFGAFFVFLAQTPGDSGLWSLVPARVTSITMVIALLLWRRERFRPDQPDRTVAVGIVVAGAGDMVANMFYVAAAQRGLLSVVAVLSSLYPAVTVTLAYLFGERVIASQWLGVALSLVAVGLIAV